MFGFLSSKSEKPASGASTNSGENSNIPARTDEDLKAAQALVKRRPSLQEIFATFDSTAIKLSGVGDVLDSQVNWDEELANSLELPYFEESGERPTLGDYLARISMPQLLYELYAKLMKSMNMEYWTEQMLSERSDMPQTSIIFRIRYLLANYSGASLLFGQQLTASGIFKYYTKDLQAMETDIPDITESNSIFESSMGAIHNCSINPANHQQFHKLRVVNHIVPYLKCHSGKVKMMVLLTLVFVIDDEENPIFLANKTIFRFLVQYLISAWKSPDHQYDGFSVDNLLSGMLGLAKNDENKRELLAIGTLHILKVILKSGSVVEKRPAIECLWELSFSKENRIIILANHEVMELLMSLGRSDNKMIAKAASSAYWVLQAEERERQLAEEGIKLEKKPTGHIMISYAWSDLNKVIQIKEQLYKSNYDVWLNIDNVLGTTLQAVIEAIDKSSVFLMCMSNNYKQSQNCRTEAEYAFSIKKDIVAVVMERGYHAEGWLQTIKGDHLFFDLSGKYPFETKMRQLIRELGARGKIRKEQQQPATTMAEATATTTAEATATDTTTAAEASTHARFQRPVADIGGHASCSMWSSKDVLNWLAKNNMRDNTVLRSLTGKQLAFLQELSTRAPEFYFNYIERNFGLNSLEELMKFSKAVDNL
ncbi:uncharacterized protein LOC121383801 isoform X2 [Gigantopelta aegis]|uniref:uncharacterized protein LOC121383801 isoform X2 n=1 Tax=Gigantopelta aegis TaxID=1735272 RepID=UPI001B88E302|nr:uncharacterized protein LOC121383801 isoform X2 [Gigantopelta aegis]